MLFLDRITKADQCSKYVLFSSAFKSHVLFSIKKGKKKKKSPQILYLISVYNYAQFKCHPYAEQWLHQSNHGKMSKGVSANWTGYNFSQCVLVLF